MKEPAMTALTLENPNVSVAVWPADGAVWCRVRDLRTGVQWGETLLVALEIHDKTLRRTDRVERYEVRRLDKVDGGIHVCVAAPYYAVEVGVWVRLMDAEVAVTVHPMEVYEHEAALYRLFALDVAPNLMRVGPDGALYHPVMSGMKCRPAGKPALADRYLIYGEQERWELMPQLPYVAAETPHAGLAAVAVAGAADTECRLATDGRGNGQVGMAFRFRGLWRDPVDFARREIRFAPVPSPGRTDLFIAKRVRRHVLEDLGKLRLRDRAAESPEVAYVLGAYTVKAFFAVQSGVRQVQPWVRVSGDEAKNTYHIMMTYAECRESLAALKRAGLDNIYVQTVGWNPGGHDGLYPTRLPPDERLGGATAFQEYVAAGQSLGYMISVHDNYSDAYRASPDWDPDTAVWDCDGDPLVTGIWAGGISYRQWPLAFGDHRLRRDMEALKALGVRGMYYCDAMGNPLEINYHPRWKGPRSDHAKGVVRVLETAKEVFGAVAIESGYLYGALAADYAANPCWPHAQPLRPEWPVTALCDQKLPIWLVALHDLVMHEAQGLTWRDVMGKLLSGAQPRAEWSAHSGCAPVLDDAMIAAMRAEYELVVRRFGRLRSLELLDLHAVADDVYESRFEDGTEVVADFNTETLVVNGEKISPPPSLQPKKPKPR
jgi:hypothetical protein